MAETEQVGEVERSYYNAVSLGRLLRAFEERYGLTSAEFYAAHQADDERVAEIFRFHRHSWASFYRDYRRLSGEQFAEQVERELTLA